MLQLSLRYHAFQPHRDRAEYSIPISNRRESDYSLFVRIRLQLQPRPNTNRMAYCSRVDDPAATYVRARGSLISGSWLLRFDHCVSTYAAVYYY